MKDNKFSVEIIELFAGLVNGKVYYGRTQRKRDYNDKFFVVGELDTNDGKVMSVVELDHQKLMGSLTELSKFVIDKKINTIKPKTMNFQNHKINLN